MDLAAEHDLVDLGRDHHEALHPYAQREARRAPDGREQERLAEDVGVHLARREAEHFEGGYLAHALRDVDVREVAQHDERERRGRHHQHDHDHVHARQHVAVGVDGLVVVGHGLHAVHGPQLLAEPHALLAGRRDVGEHRVVSRRLPRQPLVEARAHEHVVVDVVLHDPVHGCLVGGGRGVADGVLLRERDGVSCLKPQFASQLFADEQAVVRKLHRIVPDAGAQREELAERGRVLGDDELDARVARVRPACEQALLQRHRVRGHNIAVIQDGLDGAPPVGAGLVVAGDVVLERDGGVVLDDLAELLVDDVVDGVGEPQPREQQRRASCNADHGHDEALLVAEQVAERHLPRKGEPAPQRRGALQQDAPARFRGARQHEGGRPLAQRGPCRRPGGEQRHAHAEPERKGRQRPVDGKRQGHGRNEVDDGVRLHDDGGQHLREDGYAHEAAGAAGHGGVDQVLRDDAEPAVSQRLERADEHALLLHHARHGGERHERGHQEEDEREHLRDGIHAIRVGFEAGHAVVRRAVHDEPVGSFEVVDLPLGIVELALGVGQLRIGVGPLPLVLGEALLVVGPALRKLLAAAHQLRRGFVELPLSGCQLGVGLLASGGKVGAAPVELGGRIVKLGRLRLKLVLVLDEVLQLVQLIVLRLHLALQKGGLLRDGLVFLACGIEPFQLRLQSRERLPIEGDLLRQLARKPFSLIVRQARLGPRGFEQRRGLVKGRPAGIELGLPLLELPRAVGEPGLGRFALAGQLRNPALVGRLAVGQVLLAAGDGRCRLVQPALGLVQLRLGVGLLALVFGAAVVELFLGIGLQPVDARLLALGSDGLDAVHDLGNALVVGIARSVLSGGAAHGDERFGVGQIVVEVAFRHVQVLLDGAGAERGGSHARRGGVVRGAHVAHHGVRARGQRLVHVPDALRDDDGVPDARRAVHHEVGRQHAFPLVFRPGSLHEDGPVQIAGILGKRMDAVGGVAVPRSIGQRMHARCVLLARDRGHDVGLVGAHDGLDALHLAQGREVAVGEAERRDDADVHEGRPVVELVGRQLHVGRGHAQAGVEARAQRDDGRDGQEPPERMGDRAERLCSERASHKAPATTRWIRRMQGARSRPRRPRAPPERG